MSLTFNNIQTLSSSGFKSEIQKIAVDGNNVYIVWVRLNSNNSQYSIYFKKSQDGGNNFLDSILIDNEGPNEVSELDILANGQYIHILWNRTNTTPSPQQDQIDYKRSTDYGTNFSSTNTIASYATNGSQQNMYFYNDTIAIVWSELDATTSRFVIKYILSDDNGTTFSSKVSLSENTQNASNPKIIIDNNYVHVVWVWNDVSANQVIQYRKSTQGSRTNFDNVVNMSVNTSNSFFPVIDLNENYVYISWMQLNDRAKMIINFNHSSDNGNSFGAVKQIGGGILSSANVFRMKSIGNYVYLLTQSTNGGWGEILFNLSSDNGDNFNMQNYSGSQSVLNVYIENSNDPEMAVIGSHIYVVFKSNDGNNNRVRFVSSNNNGNFFNPYPPSTLSLVNKTGGSPQVAVDSENTKIHVCWASDSGGFEKLIKYNNASSIIVPPPVASACFLKDTIIKTDSGNVKIQDIKENKHAINGKKVKALTKTLYAKKGDHIPPFLISIQKDALFKNSPDKETFVSPWHKIFYNGKLIQVKDLLNKENFSLIMYNYKDFVYDILLNTHEKMIANNMIVETLDPHSILGNYYKHFVLNTKISKKELELATSVLTSFNNFYWKHHNIEMTKTKVKIRSEKKIITKFLKNCQNKTIFKKFL